MELLKKLLKEAGHYERPVGFHRETGQLALLKDVIHQTESLHPVEKLDDRQRAELVVERWKAGEWSDLYVGRELVDLERALKEVTNNTEIGQGLIKTSIRAVEMMLEDIEKAKQRGAQ